MNEPRNVTPGHDEGDEFRARYRQERAEEPEWMAWKWANRGRGFPWLGVLLVLIGLALLVQYFVPSVSAGTLVLLAIGLAFLAGWLFGGSWVSMIPGVLVSSLGAAELIEDLALLGPAGDDVPGLASAMLALGFLAIWLLGYVSNKRSRWPLWGAAIFGLIGFAQLSGRILDLPVLGALWPLLIIGLGVIVLLSARRR
ncbi:MAG TPA: hypothetical protein VNT28_01850 [Candidatus Limnocylindrales bacterium]|nr:hypothetical protein [Candidatus Limnocylindrales bacterium]